MSTFEKELFWVSCEEVCTTELTKDTKDWEIITFQFLNFVLFATFVVIMFVSILVAALMR
jgi:hypothetical protein